MTQEKFKCKKCGDEFDKDSDAMMHAAFDATCGIIEQTEGAEIDDVDILEAMNLGTLVKKENK